MKLFYTFTKVCQCKEHYDSDDKNTDIYVLTVICKAGVLISQNEISEEVQF